MTFNRRKPKYTWKKPAVFAGPEHLGGGGGGGVPPPKKVKKGGPTCREGALAKFVKLRICSLNYGIFWEMLCCEKFWELLFSET
jgi:hypothetical protein